MTEIAATDTERRNEGSEFMSGFGDIAAMTKGRLGRN